MERDLREHIEIIERNQKTILQEVQLSHQKLDESLANIVAILRGIEDELRRQRRR